MSSKDRYTGGAFPTFDLEPEDVKELERVAMSTLGREMNVEALHLQIDKIAEEGGNVVLVDPSNLIELVWCFNQVPAFVTTISHLLREGRVSFVEYQKQRERFEAELTEKMDKVSGRMIQLEQENRELRRWKEAAQQDFHIPDTWSP